MTSQQVIHRQTSSSISSESVSAFSHTNTHAYVCTPTHSLKRTHTHTTTHTHTHTHTHTLNPPILIYLFFPNCSPSLSLFRLQGQTEETVIFVTPQAQGSRLIFVLFFIRDRGLGASVGHYFSVRFTPMHQPRK